MPHTALDTLRLRLRPWQDDDLAPFAALSQDAEVMRYLRPIPTLTDAEAWIARQRAHFDAHGFGFWVVERRDRPGLIGVIGLVHISYDAHFTPAVEIGWRLARAQWGQGYAPEAAAAALRFGFQQLALPEIVANAAPANAQSQAVMRRLGMTRSPADDFDHPRLPEGDPLRPQVLYRLSRADWLAAQPATTNPATTNEEHA